MNYYEKQNILISFPFLSKPNLGDPDYGAFVTKIIILCQEQGLIALPQLGLESKGSSNPRAHTNQLSYYILGLKDEYL